MARAGPIGRSPSRRSAIGATLFRPVPTPGPSFLQDAARLQQSLTPKARMALAADHEVIMDRDAQRL